MAEGATSAGLRVSHTPPAVDVKEMVYFIKPRSSIVQPWHDFNAVVQHGKLHGDYLDSIYESMGQIFSPIMRFNKMSWPVSVRNEFAAGINKFMTQLTETYVVLSDVKLWPAIPVFEEAGGDVLAPWQCVTVACCLCLRVHNAIPVIRS